MTKIDKITTTDAKRYNKNRVFRLIHYAGRISRQEIGDILQLSLPTVNQNLKALTEEGLIVFEGNFESTGGRKAQIITINAAARYAVSVNIFDNGIQIAVVNLAGDIIKVINKPIILKSGDNSGKKVAEAVIEVVNECKIPEESLLGVGITVPGVFDSEHKVIVSAPTMGLYSYPMSEVTDNLPYTCISYNDARANAFAEYWWNWRKNEEAHNLGYFKGLHDDTVEGKLYLMLNYGVGGSYLDNERIRTGKNNCYGEFGHMTIHPGGRQCFCGKKGCFESYVSSRCLSTELGVSLDYFFKEMEAGNIVYENLFDSYLDDLTTGINNLYVMSDSEVIVGGPVSRHLKPYMKDIRKRLSQKYAFDTDGSYCSLAKCTPLQADSGAALEFLTEYIRNI